MSNRPSTTVITISTATAFSLLGDQMLYAVLPVYFDELGLTAIEVGILLSANRWIRLLTNHLAHVASPYAPPRIWLNAAFVLGAFTTLGYAVTQSFTVLVIARLLWGLCWSFIRHVGVLEVMHHAPADGGGRAMGLYNGISRVGSVAGLLGGAALVDALGYVAAVIVLAVISIVSIVLTLHDRNLGTIVARPHSHTPEAARTRESNVYLALGFSLGIVGPGFVTATLGVVLQPYADHAPSIPGITAATITGALLAIRFVLESALAPWLGSVTDRWGIRRAATVFFLLGGVALMAACTEPGSLLVLGAFVMAFFVSSTALQSGVAASVSRHGSQVYSRYVTAADVGSAAGPLLGWIAVDYFGYAAVGLLLGSVFYLASAAVGLRYLRRRVNRRSGGCAH